MTELSDVVVEGANAPTLSKMLESYTGEVSFFVHQESFYNELGDELEDRFWNQFGTEDSQQNLGSNRRDNLKKVRYLSTYNAYVKRALALYEYYVLNDNLKVSMVRNYYEDTLDVPKSQLKQNKRIQKESSQRWWNFTEANRGGWSLSEFGRRFYRDGETFNYKSDEAWPPKLRFIDSEKIDDLNGGDGIEVDSNDVTTITKYTRIDSNNNEVPITPDKIVFCKCDSDTKEKRGRSRFQSVIEAMRLYMIGLRKEVNHRKAQNSIVLVRKVMGGTRNAQRVVDNGVAANQSVNDMSSSGSVERLKDGSIITINGNSELEFKTPNSNFSDAAPLWKLLLQQLCAVTGFTYEMLTTDISGGNLASMLASDSPVVMMVGTERETMEQVLTPIAKLVFESAIRAGKIKGLNEEDISTMWDDWDIEITFPNITAKDKLKEAQRVNILRMQRLISAKQACEDLEYDADKQLREMQEEDDTGLFPPSPAQVAKDAADVAASSASNAKDGAGGNQNKDKPIEHKDKKEV